MAQAVVQTSTNGTAGAGATDFTSGTIPSWTGATAAGNYLIAVLGFAGDPGAITPPSGWSQVGTGQNNGTGCYHRVYEIVNAASRSGNESFSWANALNAVCCAMMELSGCATSSPHDSDGQNAFGNTTALSGGTVPTTSASAVVIGAFVQALQGTATAPTWSSPTPTGPPAATLASASASDNVAGQRARARAGFVTVIETSTGSYVPGATSTASDAWVEVTYAIKAPSSGPTTDQLAAMWQQADQQARPRTRPLPRQEQNYAAPPLFTHHLDQPQQPGPQPRPRPQQAPATVDGGPAFFLNDPNTLNPANVPSWLPGHEPRPNPRPAARQEQNYADPTSLVVLPPATSVADYGDQPKGLPRPTRGRPLYEQSFADPTPAWFLPGVPPGAYMVSWLGQDPPGAVRRPAARPYYEWVSREVPYEETVPVLDPALQAGEFIVHQTRLRRPGPFPAGLAVRDPTPIDAAAVNTAWAVPAQRPLPRPRLAPAAEPAGVDDLMPFALQQAWDVLPGLPVRPAARRVAPDAAFSLSGAGPPADDLASVSGWRQDVAARPRQWPPPVRTGDAATPPPAEGYDPQSLVLALGQAGQPPVRRSGPQRGEPPDPTAALAYAARAAADVLAGGWGQQPPQAPGARPRPVAGDSALVLDVAQAAMAPLPWQDVPPTPRRQVPAGMPLSDSGADYAAPPWSPSVVQITVAGPYYAVALSLIVSGGVCVAGQAIAE